MLLGTPSPLALLSGHLPAHEISKNVEAIQVGVLTAPVHVTPSDGLAQFVWVGKYWQHIICRVGRSWGEAGGSPPPSQSFLGGPESCWVGRGY